MRSAPCATSSKFARSPVLILAALSSSAGFERSGALYLHAAQVVSGAFVHRHCYIHARDVGGGNCGHLGKGHADAPARIVERPHRSVQQLAEARLVIGRAHSHPGDGLLQGPGGNHLVACEAHLRHGGGGPRRAKEDGEPVGAGSHHPAGYFLLAAPRGQQLLYLPGAAVEHGGRAGDFRAEQRLVRGQPCQHIPVWDTQVFEPHGVDGFHLQHLKRSRVALSAGPGGEAVAHVFKHAGGHQPVAGGLELGLAGHLPDL